MKLLRWLGQLLGREAPSSDREGEADAPLGEEGRVSPIPRSVTVGVDFGTSSTKVVFRDWNTKEKIPYAVDFGIDMPGYTRFSRPSLMALVENRVLFGQAAAEVKSRNEGNIVVRSAKVELLEEHVDPLSVEIPWKPPDGWDDQGATMLEALVTLFLADTIRRALRAAHDIYPDLIASELAFNLDIPVGGLDEGPVVARRFQRMLDVAIPLASEIENDMDAEEAFELWADNLFLVQEDPPEEGERPGELVPEAEAVIQGVGSVLGSRSSDLYHAIVDVGAGTTDVGWFKMVVTGAEDRLPFFASDTRPIGCDDIDDQLARRVMDGRRGTPQRVRRRLVKVKPDLISGKECTVRVDGRGVTVGPEDLRRAAEHVAPDIYSHYSDMFERAYRKEKNTDRWEQIRVVVVGGGSLIPEVRRRFNEHPRTFGENVELIGLSTEMDLQATGASDRAPAPEEKPFLTAALGLSHPKFVMPDPIMPSEIDEDLVEGSGPTGLYDYQVPET